MTEVLNRRFGHHVPDILDCLAQLSNDQVPTPPKVARAMLDILPLHEWSEPNYRWLDPCCKSGVFLREIASRLLAEYRGAHARGPLDEEASALAIEAGLRLGDGSAPRHARAYLERYPEGRFARLAESALAPR